MDTGSLAKLFGDIPTGGHAVDSEDVAEFGNGEGGGVQTDAYSTKAQSSHLV